MAAASLIMIPASIVFIIFQKQFIKGITMTGNEITKNVEKKKLKKARSIKIKCKC